MRILKKLGRFTTNEEKRKGGKKKNNISGSVRGRYVKKGRYVTSSFFFSASFSFLVLIIIVDEVSENEKYAS